MQTQTWIGIHQANQNGGDAHHRYEGWREPFQPSLVKAVEKDEQAFAAVPHERRRDYISGNNEEYIHAKEATWKEPLVEMINNDGDNCNGA